MGASVLAGKDGRMQGAPRCFLAPARGPSRAAALTRARMLWTHTGALSSHLLRYWDARAYLGSGHCRSRPAGRRQSRSRRRRRNSALCPPSCCRASARGRAGAGSRARAREGCVRCQASMSKSNTQPGRGAVAGSVPRRNEWRFPCGRRLSCTTANVGRGGAAARRRGGAAVFSTNE